MHPDYVDEVALVARSLRDNPNSTVLVVGHTDNVGRTDYNQALSERRAGSVAAILSGDGVEGWRLQTVGRGFEPAGRLQRQPRRPRPESPGRDRHHPDRQPGVTRRPSRPL